MNKTDLFEWIDRQRRRLYIIAAPLFILLAAGVYFLVYITGGIKFVYSHSMYIPILLSGFVFGIKGGVFAGLIGGFILGPFMPIDISTGEMQKTINWLYRTAFFTLIGFLSGAASDSAKAYIKHLKWISTHDASTLLPNRTALINDLPRIEGKKKPPESLLLLAVICIENFIELKSTFGFAVIEEGIKQLAKRLENISAVQGLYYTATSQLCLLVKVENSRKQDEILDNLLEQSRHPFVYNSISIHVETGMGSIFLNQEADPPEQYLQKAEAALAVAREQAKNRVAYGPEIMAVTEKNLLILGGLKDAIENNQLSVYYQPKVLLPSGRPHGAEALVRWDHPLWGQLQPEVFMPRAEQTTLIHMITEFVLSIVAAQIAGWKQSGLDVPVAVNISTRNLLKPGFADFIFGLIDRHALDPEMLELEITESSLMTDLERTTGELGRLAKLGIVISIDDFGTGYSSLKYLHRLPISLIKIDQSFIRRLPYDKGAAYIVEATVILARKMGIKTIAEGVENRDIYEFLCKTGCDMAQGFLISGPLQAETYKQWHAADHENIYSQRDSSKTPETP